MQVGAGVLPGEQPAGIGEGACRAEGLGDRQRGDQGVERRDEQQWLGAEGEVGVAVADLDVAGEDEADGFELEGRLAA